MILPVWVYTNSTPLHPSRSSRWTMTIYNLFPNMAHLDQFCSLVLTHMITQNKPYLNDLNGKQKHNVDDIQSWIWTHPVFESTKMRQTLLVWYYIYIHIYIHINNCPLLCAANQIHIYIYTPYLCMLHIWMYILCVWIFTMIYMHWYHKHPKTLTMLVTNQLG